MSEARSGTRSLSKPRLTPVTTASKSTTNSVAKSSSNSTGTPVRTKLKAKASPKSTPKPTSKPTPKSTSKKTSKTLSAPASKPSPKLASKPASKATPVAVKAPPLISSASQLTTVPITAPVVEELTRRLTQLYGVGPQLASALIKYLHAYKLVPRSSEGLKAFSDERLRAALRDHRIYPSLPAATRMDLDYHPLNRIPRALIDLLDRELKKNSIPGVRYQVAGSYMRGAATSGDIDMVFGVTGAGKGTAHEAWERMRKKINANSRILKILDPFSDGDDRVGHAFQMIVPPKLRKNEHLIPYLDAKHHVCFKADVFLTSPAEYDIALLYATGSGLFNIRMRALAKRKGFMLNQHGLYRVSASGLENTGAKTQKEIFQLLGMRWREPEQRNY